MEAEKIKNTLEPDQQIIGQPVTQDVPQTEPAATKQTGRLWVGGEMKTFAPQGAFIGSIVGLAVGVILATVIWLNKGDVSMSIPDTTSPGKSDVFMFVAPIVGFFFGGFAGTLIGVGTPKHNPHPEQGVRRNWRSVFPYSRQKRS